MVTKSKNEWNIVFSFIAIVIGLLSLLYCSTLMLEPLSEVDAPEFFAQLSRYIRGGV